MSATRFGEQAGIPYSRCGRTKAPYKGMKLVAFKWVEYYLTVKVSWTYPITIYDSNKIIIG